MRLDYRYCLTADCKRLVKDTDPDAQTLLYIVGTEISDEEAAKYGLSKPPAIKQVRPENKEKAK